MHFPISVVLSAVILGKNKNKNKKAQDRGIRDHPPKAFVSKNFRCKISYFFTIFNATSLPPVSSFLFLKKNLFVCLLVCFWIYRFALH